MARVLGCAGVVLLIGVYGCDAGHGFVKDDFNWILTSRVERPGEIVRLFGAATGFFRPLVSLSFALDHALFGLNPLGYALTNLALLLACVGMLAMLLRSARLDGRIAMAASLVWALNFHGINMAVLWISGRTALLMTLLAVAAAWAWSRGSRTLAALLAMGAMWSKEEALVLPAILTGWSIVERRGLAATARAVWPLWLAAAISVAIRTWAGAFTPATAPAVYRYQYDLATAAGNGLAYLDRAATTPALALLVFWLASGAHRGPRPDSTAPGHTAALAAKGAIWFVLALTPTILLPVRSSLYAVLPSVGSVIVAAGLAQRVAGSARPADLARGAAVLALVFVALFPAYRLRNRRYVQEGALSAAISRQLSAIAAAHPDGGLVVIRDARDTRPTAEQAFGPLADRAAQLVTDGGLRLWIDPPPAELADAPLPPGLDSPVATLEVRGGAVRRVE